MLLSTTLKLLGFAAGAILHLFLVVLLARKPAPGRSERPLLAALSAGFLWQAANAIALFHGAASVEAQGALPALVLAGMANLGLVLAPAFYLHFALLWAGLPAWPSLTGYLPAPVAWWLLRTERTAAAWLWIGLLLAGAAALILCARGRTESRARAFSRVFGACLLLPFLAGMLAGPDSVGVVLASLAAPLCLLYFIYSFHLLDLLISRRVAFAVTLGLVFAVYLFVIRRVADFLEDRFETLRELTEIALIFAAALIWIPLYGWMTRFLSKRAQVYADFSKRIIEEAARILDLEMRLQYLAEQVGRTFGLRRVLLVTAGEPRLRGFFGEEPGAVAARILDQLEQFAGYAKAEVLHQRLAADPLLRSLLEEAGYNYLFPLWYEEQLTGLLLLDTSPRVFLDENEPVLLGLSRQISHSIRTCRVVEEKIGLELALTRQEHLASLGKVAATIAHEIKNPLSSVKTLAQLMREDASVREKYDRDLNYMINEVDRLNRSVQQLLAFSRPLPEERAEVDVSGLLETAADVLARQYAGDRIRIAHRIARGLKMQRGNPEIIKQILLNLALNAVQASEPEGEVLVEARGEGDSIAITISDCGPGIPAELREKIFEPFFTTKQRGTGLGLAIVRKNVRQLGGEIAIDSPIAEGRGTRVTVTLPVQ